MIIWGNNLILLIFLIAIYGMVVNRENSLQLIISLEIYFISLITNFILFTNILNSLSFSIISLIIIIFAAIESAIALVIIINFYKIRGSIKLNNLINTKF